MAQKCTVLLVDDSEEDAFFFKRALNVIGLFFHIIHLPDATRASLYLKREPPYDDPARHPPPDLIVCDSVLGHESGVDLLEWVRVHPQFKELPFVILSGGSSPAQLARAAQLGVSAVFAKPSSFTELVETIRKVVQSGPPDCHSNKSGSEL